MEDYLASIENKKKDRGFDILDPSTSSSAPEEVVELVGFLVEGTFLVVRVTA
jgi:hypothetical protein